MEIIDSIFNLICSVLVDILYDISIADNLFAFDLKSNHILIKSKNNLKKTNNNIKQVNKKSKEIKKLFHNFSPSVIKRNDILNKSFNIKSSSKRTHNLYLTIEGQKNTSNDNESIRSKYSNIPIQPVLINIKENETKQKNEINNDIIYRIEKTQYLFYLCFLCTKKRKNINNILFEEAMNIISEKLDIFNIFKIVNISKKTLNKYDKYEKIYMSVECVKNLNKLNNKNKTSFFN